MISNVQGHLRAGEFGDPGPVTDLAVLLDRRRPDRGRNLENVLVDGLGDHHADRVGQSPPALGESGNELNGPARGITVDQRLPVPPVLLRQLGQGTAGGRDVVGGRARARVPGTQEGRDGFAGSLQGVVDECRAWAGFPLSGPV